jgi:hypothetical protein
MSHQRKRMTVSEPEIPLAGGNTNTVVRKGNTVRRTTRASSPTVHRLLTYLQQRGYTGAPVFLGIDEKGREILSYIEGRCDITSDAWTSDRLIESTARGLKILHDITASFPHSTRDTWAITYPDQSRHEVICHNDLGLYNLVTNDNQLSGFIDFDLAGPGPRLRDIAYACYWLIPLSPCAGDMKPFALADLNNGCRRLKLFYRCYGLELTVDTLHALLTMVSETLHHLASKEEMITLFGHTVAEQLSRGGHLQHWQREALAFDLHRQNIERAFRYGPV